MNVKATDTRGLTVEQRAKLAYALAIIRHTQSLRGWSQYRMPANGEVHTLRLLKRVRGKVALVYSVVER
jgi:hypothetical protein